MNKIKELNSIFAYWGYRYYGYENEDIRFSFLNKIYSQCNLKHVVITKRNWLDHLYCNCMLCNLYYRISEHEKFLYL
jgi:hypothetical protein